MFQTNMFEILNSYFPCSFEQGYLSFIKDCDKNTFYIIEDASVNEIELLKDILYNQSIHKKLHKRWTIIKNLNNLVKNFKMYSRMIQVFENTPVKLFKEYLDGYKHPDVYPFKHNVLYDIGIFNQIWSLDEGLSFYYMVINELDTSFSLEETNEWYMFLYTNKYTKYETSALYNKYMILQEFLHQINKT